MAKDKKPADYGPFCVNTIRPSVTAEMSPVSGTLPRYLQESYLTTQIVRPVGEGRGTEAAASSRPLKHDQDTTAADPAVKFTLLLPRQIDVSEAG